MGVQRRDERRRGEEERDAPTCSDNMSQRKRGRYFIVQMSSAHFDPFFPPIISYDKGHAVHRISALSRAARGPPSKKENEPE